MAHKRKEFTDNQKAEIYARDNATCAFSCISLWILDIGIRPNWEDDWVDHIKPSASGGGAELDNGICASETFNKKKRDNTSDNIHFTKEGRITKDFIQVFGVPSEKLVSQLSRLSNLASADWFFNRSITCIYTAFDWRCNVEFHNKVRKRDDTYWLKSAWKRLQTYRKKKSSSGILKRGLIMSEPAFGTLKLLEIENITDYDEFINWSEEVYPVYRGNYKLMYEYFETDDTAKRVKLLENAKKVVHINPEVIESLLVHNSL